MMKKVGRLGLALLLGVLGVRLLMLMLVGTPVTVVASPPAAGATHRVVFNTAAITQTEQTGSQVDVLGTTSRYVLYRLETAAVTTATVTMTVESMWMTNVMATSINTDTVISTTETTGAITVTGSLFATALQVKVDVSAGTVTSTLGVVAQ